MDGSVIQRDDNAKKLGVTFSSDHTWNVHVENITSKAGGIYMLYQLKRYRSGCSRDIRPVVEYTCPVWSTNLPKYFVRQY